MVNLLPVVTSSLIGTFAFEQRPAARASIGWTFEYHAGRRNPTALEEGG